jgi:hypothetical protein
MCVIFNIFQQTRSIFRISSVLSLRVAAPGYFSSPLTLMGSYFLLQFAEFVLHCRRIMEQLRIIKTAANPPPPPPPVNMALMSFLSSLWFLLSSVVDSKLFGQVGSGSDLFDKKICILFASFSSKWSNSSLLYTYFLRKSLKCLKSLAAVPLKICQFYLVGRF